MAKSILTASHAQIAINPVCMVKREEYLDYMTFQANRRPLFTEIFGPLLQCKQEWIEQGATPAELDLSAFPYRRPAFGVIPLDFGFMGGPAEKIVEETDEHIIARDGMGRLMKLAKQASTLPLPLTHPVTCMADWLRLKPHYQFSEERLGKDWEQIARRWHDEGKVVTVAMLGGFYEPRELMGVGNFCLAFYEQPELVHDMLDTLAETAERILDRVSAAVQVDYAVVGEDLAGKSGPLLGPKQVREFLAPYYRRLFDPLRARGCRLFGMDSDGQLDAVLPDLIDAGLNFVYPLEPAAGMDIVKVRKQFPRLGMMGGIDKHALRHGREAIVAELEYKIPPLVKTGGCMLGLDHRIPNGVTLENYRFYIRTAWEILDREAAKL